jgi:hypothetical protein
MFRDTTDVCAAFVAKADCAIFSVDVRPIDI